MNPFALYDPFADMDRRAAGAGFFVDISENDDNYVLRAELPGVEKKNVGVEAADGVISIAAEFSASGESGKPLYAERVFGKARRSFAMPRDAALNQSAADMTNGVLTLTVPKREDAKRRRISVE